MTNICMLTTWDSRCGIFQYSKNLAEEFVSLGHNVLILANRGSEKTKVYPNITVKKGLFGVLWWNEPAEFLADKMLNNMKRYEKEYGTIDALVVQYQGSLYKADGFNIFLDSVDCPIIVLRHDSSIDPSHVFPERTAWVVHNECIPYGYYIPFPVPERIPSVFSFGMSRNNYKFIEEVCREIGIHFDYHDAKEHGWISEDELFDRINLADAIVLWYNDVSLEGQSAALRTAIAGMRPVIVNDINWFRDAPDFVTKVSTKSAGREFTVKKALQATLWDILHLEYIRSKSFSSCAKQYLNIIHAEMEHQSETKKVK